MTTTDPAPAARSAFVRSPRPSRSAAVLEADLEKYFRKAIVGLLRGRLLKLAPTEVGCPDRLVLLPGGRMYLVELKAEGGTLRPKQKHWHARARLQGTIVHVLTGRAGIDAWIAQRQQDLYTR